MKYLIKIKLIVFCVATLCVLSYKLGQNSKPTPEAEAEAGNVIYLNPVNE